MAFGTSSSSHAPAKTASKDADEDEPQKERQATHEEYLESLAWSQEHAMKQRAINLMRSIPGLADQIKALEKEEKEPEAKKKK
jgi:hypothetical protein